MNLTQAISYFLNSGLLQSFCQLPCAINSAITLASFAVSFCSGLLAVSFPFSLSIYFFMSALFVVQNLPPVYALKFYGLGYKLTLQWYRYYAIVISDLRSTRVRLMDLTDVSKKKYLFHLSTSVDYE